MKNTEKSIDSDIFASVTNLRCWLEKNGINSTGVKLRVVLSIPADAQIAAISLYKELYPVANGKNSLCLEGVEVVFVGESYENI